MSRMFRCAAVLMAATALTAPAVAEDSYMDLRDAYPTQPSQWAGLGDTDDSLKLEFGVRYWYSIGGHDFNTYGGNFYSTDTAHIGELHLRIEDHHTNTFAKAIAGYSALIQGDYTDPFNPPGTIADGHVGYIGADFGWNTFGNDNGAGIGPTVGYMYWNDSPNTTRANYTTAEPGDVINFDPNTGATSGFGFDSTPNNVDVHVLRLGVQGKVDLGGFVDIDGEANVVPYAKISGVIGSDETATTTTGLGNIDTVKGSPTTIDGWGYGAMGQLMFGIHPSENLTFRLGGRAWYLQGTVDATYADVTIGDPTDSDPLDTVNYDTAPTVSKQYHVEPGNPFSLLRYGLLAEMTYSF